jgi:hypothetical protein
MKDFFLDVYTKGGHLPYYTSNRLTCSSELYTYTALYLFEYQLSCTAYLTLFLNMIARLLGIP